MLTEKEVLDYVNNGLKDKSLKEETQKYTSKLLTLDGLIKENDNKIKELEEEKSEAKREDLRLRGALSMLLELIAESEGLISDQPQDTPDTQ